MGERSESATHAASHGALPSDAGGNAGGNAGAPGTPVPADAEAIFSDQVRLAARNVPLALLGLLGNVLVLGYVLWDLQPRQRLLIWLGLMIALIAVRAGAHAWLARSIATPAGARHWQRWALAGTLATGLAWGAVALLYPDQRPTHLVFVAFLTGGLSAGSMAAYGSLAWLPFAYIAPAAVGVIAAFALRGDRLSFVMGGMVAFFVALLVPMTRGLHRTVLDALRLRMENQGLNAYLSDAKAGADRLNADLRQGLSGREQAEQALRESEERFRALVENATDGIGFTFEGRIHYANQAALDLIGYRAEEILGKPIQEFLAQTTFSRDHLYQRYEDRIAGKDVPRQYETQMVRKDGTVVDVIFSNSLVTLDGKKGVMSIVKDITERKKVEQELREAKDAAEDATRLKDQFVSLVAHDLRAPLNTVLSMIGLLDKDSAHPLSPEQERIVRTVGEHGETTLRMIEDLLSVSRLQTGKLKPEPRFVDALGVVSTAVSLLRPLAREKRIELLSEVPHHTRLFTDPDMFGKVIYNLLANAIKFCRAGNRIRLSVPKDRPSAISVEDNGPGVEPSLLGDLFRHDVKTSRPGSAGERGTGLGLPLSQDLMHALGGEITVEPAQPSGSVFTAVLPAVRPKVLVVGYDESLALFVRPQLESIEADFLGAASGEEALHKLEAEGAHLVIAESKLAGNGGMVLLQRIREAPGGRTVPLMLVADKSEAGLMEHGFRLGADEIVVKPLVPDDFLVRLRRFIM